MRCVPPLHEGSKILLNPNHSSIRSNHWQCRGVHAMAAYANLPLPRIIGYTQSHRDMNAHYMHEQFSSPDSSLMTKY